jgi:molybdenum cofactor cytidylyltransferase
VLSAVILAAGASSRMGSPKQLLRFRGQSLLRRAIETARDVPAEQVIVVLGYAADRLLAEVEPTGATVVLNDQWMEGVSTSLRGGLAAVAPESRGVFVYPADMPLITPEALRELAHRQQASGRPAAVTEVGGVRGVPVFLTRSLFPALMIQEGDVGGAHYLRAHPDLVEAVHFADPDLVRDVDRPEDYERLLELDPDFPPDADRDVAARPATS